jgi:type II secretory pathway component PulF
MTTNGTFNGGALSWEQLLALNDEMAALARAGVPLECGLLDMSRELSGRPGKLAEFLGTRLNAGESLPQILAREKERFPPIWRAVVEAGLRAGQLPAALEAMSVTGRRVAEVRKSLGAALLYPLVVVAVAFATFVLLATRLAPVTSRAYRDLTGASEPLLTALSWLGERAHWWAGSLPVLLIIVLGITWYRSGLPAWLHRPTVTARQRRGWLRWLSLGNVLRDGRMAAFAEILSLLVTRRVPLQDALVLAADASGDRGLCRGAQAVAERVERGEVFIRREDLPAEFPPLLGWLLVTGVHQPGLSDALTRTAMVYRERAARAATWTAVYLPIVLTVLIGGSVTLLQALATFGPIWKLWYALGQPL